MPHASTLRLCTAGSDGNRLAILRIPWAYQQWIRRSLRRAYPPISSRINPRIKAGVTQEEGHTGFLIHLLSAWTGADLLKMIDILGLSDLGPFLREQEFLPDDPNEESPFGSLDAAELEEVFEDSGVPRIQIDALKVALRYLKGEFTNVSVKA